MRFILVYSILAAWILTSCQQEEKALKPMDLKPYGVEMSILAPDSTTVHIKEYPFMRDINIRKDDHFHIQLFELQSNKNDPVTEKARQVKAVQKDPGFLEVIKEYDQGFIYSKQLDSTKVDYDFRYFRYLGDTQLIFQSAVLTAFSLEDVEQMIEALQYETKN